METGARLENVNTIVCHRNQGLRLALFRLSSGIILSGIEPALALAGKGGSWAELGPRRLRFPKSFFAPGSRRPPFSPSLSRRSPPSPPPPLLFVASPLLAMERDSKRARTADPSENPYLAHLSTTGTSTGYGTAAGGGGAGPTEGWIPRKVNGAQVGKAMVSLKSLLLAFDRRGLGRRRAGRGGGRRATESVGERRELTGFFCWRAGRPRQPFQRTPSLAAVL